MLALIPWYPFVLLLMLVYGLLPFKLMGKPLPANPFSLLIIGLCCLGFMSMLCWLVAPVGIAFQAIVFAGALVVTVCYRQAVCDRVIDIKNWLSQLPVVAKAALSLVSIIVVYQGALETKITDMGMYYMQTMLWMQSHAAIPGLANLHPALGLGSAWHSLAVLLNPVSLGLGNKWQINGVLLLIYIGYALYQSQLYADVFVRAVFVCVVPLAFFYLTAPSPDLALLVLSATVFSWAWYTSYKIPPVCIIVCAVFIFACKPPAFIAILSAVTIIFKQAGWVRRAKYVTLALVLCVPVLIRNYTLSGYLLYPFNKPAVAHAPWQVPHNWNAAYRNGIISWGYNNRLDKQTLVKGDSISLQRFHAWLTRDGYKGLFNKFIFLNFLAGIAGLIATLAGSERRLRTVVVYAAFLLMSVAEWLYLSQYRLLMPTAFTLAAFNGVFIFSRIKNNRSFNFNASSITKSLLVFITVVYSLLAFMPYELFSDTTVSKAITRSTGFNKAYLLKPWDGLKNQHTDSAAAGDHFTYYYTGQTYAWDCKIPCISNSQRNYLYRNFGYAARQFGSDVEDGFYLVADTVKAAPPKAVF